MSRWQRKQVINTGKVSWGGGTVWQPANRDELCNGSTDAAKTIACFTSRLSGSNWAPAIAACK